MFSCLRARGFRKTCVTSVICHNLSEERRVKSDEWASLILFCALQLGELVGFHVFCRAADDDKASVAAGADSLETKFYEGSAHIDGTELLADACTDDLQGSRYGHEFACLFGTRLAEVQINQLLFKMRGLELSVMLVQLLDFFFLKPKLEAALVEGVGFGIDCLVVEGVLSWGEDAFDLERKPTAVSCGVRQELGIVACAAEGGDMLAMLMIVGVGGSLVDTRHRDDGFELVQLGWAHRIEFLAAHQGVLGEGEEVVLAHAVGIGLGIEVLFQLRREEVVEPRGFEGTLFAYQHEDYVVDGIVGKPTGDHGDEPLSQIVLPAELLRGTTFHVDGFCQFVNRMFRFPVCVIRGILWETFEVILERIEGRDVVGLDDAVEVLLVDSRHQGHFCPKGVDTAVADREPLIAFLALLVSFQIFYACGDFIIA